MPKLCYQELNLLQMLDVLRTAPMLHLALCSQGAPYVIPMHYQLEARGATPVLHMVLPPAGRAMEALLQNSLICAEIDLPAPAWLDTVVISGRGQVGLSEPGRAVEVLLVPREITGRRYFVQGGSQA